MTPSTPESDPDAGQFKELMLTEEPEFEELLDCVFGISEPVAAVYVHLHEGNGCTAKDLAQTLDCDKSSVNRKLNALREQGLVERHRNLLSVGGFTYEYEAVPLPDVQELMHETLDEWTAFMHQQIADVEDSLEPVLQE